MKAIRLIMLSILSCVLVEGNAFSIEPIEEVDAVRKLPMVTVDKNRLAIPIRRAGQLILIRAKADTLEGNFILDTGAPYLVLNETYFRNYRDNPNEQSVGVNGEAQDQKIVEIDSLLIRGISFKEIVADATNLAQIENKKGIKILGLLGVNLFLDFEMEIDLANNVIYLNKLDEENNCLSTAAFSQKDTPQWQVPVSLRRDVISFEAEINKERLRFCFDTGAEYNVLSKDAGDEALEGITIMRRMNLYGSSGGNSEVLAGIINFLDIEGHRIANMQTIVTDLSALKEAYGGNIDGLIGFPLMTRGVLCINFKAKYLSFYTPLDP
jgi:predicted aspartyl protease